MFVTLDCQKKHLLALEQLKMALENLQGMDMEQKIENHKIFEGLSVEFLSIICHFETFSVYI